MTTYEVKKSVARKVTQHTILAAFSTIDLAGLPNWVVGDLQADLHELDKLEDSPLVEAAKTLVRVATSHGIYPNETTHKEARAARDILADLMINAKEIKG